MKTDFNCLYFLENEQYVIVEIKRNDLSEDADLSDVFRWLVLNKSTREVLSLIFRSMDSSGEVQERFFEQGYLKFNNESGTYIEKFNSGQYQFENKTGTPLPLETVNTIIAYLDN
ncbi:hypothetical protein [Pedobacter nyackensis]|uniref:hypothetical protein n=1 Tax=Pedobacter nyackensis TaxID=475255 RepID=UPI00293194D5|nr:hypothetical protein [Pedobacter nyackensis]